MIHHDSSWFIMIHHDSSWFGFLIGWPMDDHPSIHPSIHISYTNPSIHISYTNPSIHISYTNPSIHISYTNPSIHISYTNPSIHISYSIIYHALTLAHVTHFAIPKQITEICPSELLLFRVRELCPGTSWRVASLAWEKTRAIKNQKMSGFQLKHAGFHAAYAAWVWWAVLHVLWKEIPPKTSNWSTGKDPKGMS